MKCGTHNKNKNKTISKIIALLLALSMPSSLSACVKNDGNDENFDEYQKTTENFLDTTVEEKKSNNYSNSTVEEKSEEVEKMSNDYIDDKVEENLNDIIKQVLDTKYISENNNFNSSLILDYTKKEYESIKKKGGYKFEEISSANYDWLKDGKINSNKLKERLISNCEKNGLPCDFETQGYCDLIANNAEKLINYVIQKNNNFNFNYYYKLLDTLTVDKVFDEFCIGYYEYFNNVMAFNSTYMNENELSIINVLHEMFHQVMYKKTLDQSVVINGSTIDDLSCIYSVFSLNFMKEFICQDSACDIMGHPEYNEYNKERKTIELIKKSIKNKNVDFTSLLLDCNINSIGRVFEKEVQDVYFVYSTLGALDISLGYSNFTCDESFKKECFNYSKLNLLKNYTILLLKEYMNNEITKEQFIIEFDRYVNSNNDLEYENSNGYLKGTEEIKKTCVSFIQKNELNYKVR